MPSAADALLRYQLRAERLSVGTARVLIRDVDAALSHVAAELKRRVPGDAPFTYARLQALQSELTALRLTLQAKVNGTLTATIRATAETAGRATAGALTSLPIHWSTTAVPLEQLVASAMRPFDGKPWSEWGAKLADDTIGRLESELRQAAALGERIPDIGKRFERVAGLSRASATRLARTATMDASNRAMVETFKAFGVAKLRFTATLDSRTSIQCASLDGREFPIGEAPRPPLHPNCRSVLVPVVDLEGVPEGQRASADGPVAASTSFETWLKGQDEDFQREYLGPTRFTAWQEGLPLSSMATSDRELTIDELKRIYPDKVPA